ncbi:hypothetical protein V2O64_11400 [Verrucomicrobiaceae bacterium 227]
MSFQGSAGDVEIVLVGSNFFAVIFSKRPYLATSLTVMLCLPLGYVAAMAFEEQTHEIPQERTVGRQEQAVDSKLMSRESERGRVPADPGSRLGMLERIAAAGIDELPELSREIYEGSGLTTFYLREALIDCWIEVDSQKGWTFFLGEKAKEGRTRYTSVTHEYCGRWALVDPDSALAAAQGINDEEARKSATISIGSSLSSHSPVDYFRLLSGPDRAQF